MMFEKILYPTDFSDVAASALDFIKQLKEAGAKEVVILHVIDERSFYNMDRYAAQYADISLIRGNMEDEIAHSMGALEEELSEAGFKVTARIEHGVPFSTILRIEEEEGVSVIVIGSHGRSNIADMLMGSVSEKVVRKANRPVIIIKR